MTSCFKPYPLHFLHPAVWCTILLLAANGCQRSTCVSGVVTDAVSGQPVRSAHLELKGFDGNDPHDSTNPKLVATETTETDSFGRYSLELAHKGVDKVRLELYQPDFDARIYNEMRSAEAALHRCREVDITYDHFSGLLRLVFNNTSGTASKIYLRVNCDYLNEPGNVMCNPAFEHEIQPGESKTIPVPVAAGRYVPFLWDTQPFAGWVAPHTDSVYCALKDTTIREISF